MKNEVFKKNNSFFYIGILVLFFALGLLIYGNALSNPFIMDDESQVIQNTHIHSLLNPLSFFSSSSMDSGGAEKMAGIYYKPLMTTYYALIWNFFGDDPFAFRLPLLFIHCLSSFLIFIFSMNFLPKSYSILLGLFFLVHPVNSEVVLYIADAQDIFYFFFGLSSLLCIKFVKNKKWLFIILFFLFSCGLFSKETGALFLLIGGAYAFFFHPHKKNPVFWAMGLVGISYLFLRWQIGLTITKNSSFIFSTSSFWERVQMLPLILGHYIEIFFIPWRLSLTTDFILQGFPWNLFWQPLMIVLLFFGVLLKISHILLKSSYKKETLFFISVLFFWFILHGQLLIPLDGVYADRWFYLGVWGLGSLLFLFVYQTFASRNLIILLSILLLPLGLRSYVRSLDWAVPLEFYRREVELHPWDALMSNNLGVELFRQKNILESGPYFKKATELNPNWSVAWNNLGAVREQQHDYSAALEFYFKSINVGHYPLAYQNYAGLLINLGEREKAYQFLKERALPLYPHNSTLLELWKRVNN